MLFEQMSSTFSRKIIRAMHIRLSNVLIGLLKVHVSDSITLFVFMSQSLVFFNYIQWSMFQDLLLTMIITLLLEIFTPFEQANSELIVLYNLSVIFILLQLAARWVPKDISERVIGNIQWMYSSTLIVVLQQYLKNTIITVLVLVSLVLFLQLIKINNSQFTMLYSMAAVQSFQDLIITSIPIIFLTPTAIVLVYFMYHVVHFFGIGDEIYDFIIYTTANGVLTQLKRYYDSDIVLFISLVSMMFFHYIKAEKAESVLQMIIILVSVDFIASNLAIVYVSDPVLSLVLLSFSLKIITGLFLKK